jgi:hypothetical protein
MQNDLSRSKASAALLNSLNALAGLELDDGTQMALTMMRLLAASRFEPAERAQTLLRSMEAEINAVVGEASLPNEAGMVYATLAQTVVLQLEANCGLQRSIDSSGWRGTRRYPTYGNLDEREALMADLASQLYAGLLAGDRC